MTAFGGIEHKHDNGNDFEQNYKHPGLIEFKLEDLYTSGSPIFTLNAGLISKSVFNHIKFDERIPMYYEDILVILKIFMNYPSTYLLRETVYCYYCNPDSITHIQADSSSFSLRFICAIRFYVEITLESAKKSKKVAKAFANKCFNTYCAYIINFHNNKWEIGKNIYSLVRTEISKIIRYTSFSRKLIFIFVKRNLALVYLIKILKFLRVYLCF